MRCWWVGVVALGLAAILAGCAPRQQMTATGGPLLPSLQAYTSGDEVSFVLQVTNVTEAPLALNFRSGQSYDFEVRDGERVVWRWSDDQMFTQALRRETLPPGESLRYTATWRPPATLRGEFDVAGRLTASDHPLQQAGRITLP